MFKLVLLMHVKFHEVLFILRESLEKVWFGVQRVQRRYSLSEKTLQQGNFRGMVHSGPRRGSRI